MNLFIFVGFQKYLRVTLGASTKWPLRAFASKKTLQTGARSGHSNQRSFGSNCWRWSLQCTLLRFGKTMASCCGEKRTPFFILKSVYIYMYMYKYTYHIYTFSQNQNIYTHLQKIKISIHIFKNGLFVSSQLYVVFEFIRELFFHNQLRVPLDR